MTAFLGGIKALVQSSWSGHEGPETLARLSQEVEDEQLPQHSEICDLTDSDDRATYISPQSGAVELHPEAEPFDPGLHNHPLGTFASYEDEVQAKVMTSSSKKLKRKHGAFEPRDNLNENSPYDGTIHFSSQLSRISDIESRKRRRDKSPQPTMSRHNMNPELGDVQTNTSKGPRRLRQEIPKNMSVLNQLEFRKLSPNSLRHTQEITRGTQLPPNTMLTRAPNSNPSKSNRNFLGENAEYRSVERFVNSRPTRRIGIETNEEHDYNGSVVSGSAGTFERTTRLGTPTSSPGLQVEHETPPKRPPEEDARNMKTVRNDGAVILSELESPDPLGDDGHQMKSNLRQPRPVAVTQIAERLDRQQLRGAVQGKPGLSSRPLPLKKRALTDFDDHIEDDVKQEASPYFPNTTGRTSSTPTHREINQVQNKIRTPGSAEVVEESDAHIPRSTFVFAKGGMKDSTKSKGSLKRKETATLPLKSISYMNHTREIENAYIGLDDKENLFRVWVDGKPSIEIDPKRINRFVSSSNGTRAHLSGSLDTMSSLQTWFHLNFEDEQDMEFFEYVFKVASKGVVPPGKKMENTLLKMWQNLVMQQPTGKGLRKSMVEQEPQRTAATERRLSDAQSNSKNEARTRNTIASHMKGDDPENIERLVDTGSMRRQDRRLSTVDTVESVVRTPSTRLRRKSDQQGKVYGTQDLQQPKVIKYSEEHGLGEPWKQPVLFPSKGGNRATVDYLDLFRLDEEEFLNDNLISFFLRYCQEQHPNLATDVHIFNTYFYEKLTQPVKGQKGINYDGVKRWTSKIDLFRYNYVIVPINEHVHWYAAIICNLRNMEKTLHADDDEINTLAQTNSRVSLGRESSLDILQDDQRGSFNKVSLDEVPDSKEDPLVDETRKLSLEGDDARSDDPEVIDIKAVAKENEDIIPSARLNAPPTKKRKTAGGVKYHCDDFVIITLDSFGFTHSPVIKSLKEYLSMEGKAKRNIDISMPKGVTARGIPTQENYYDCGLYLLGYIREFFKNPQSFVRKILQKEFDVEKDWAHLSPPKLRHEIREILQDQYSKQYRGSTATSGSVRLAKSPKSSAALQRVDRPLETVTLDSPPKQLTGRGTTPLKRRDTETSKAEVTTSALHPRTVEVAMDKQISGKLKFPDAGRPSRESTVYDLTSEPEEVDYASDNTIEREEMLDQGDESTKHAALSWDTKFMASIEAAASCVKQTPLPSERGSPSATPLRNLPVFSGSTRPLGQPASPERPMTLGKQL